MSELDDLKRNIIENQKVIDELNRKTREVNIIQEISSEINSILDLSGILSSILKSLERVFQFKHSLILLINEDGDSLKVTASHGYPEKGIGAEVKFGQGVIGVVAKRKKIMRMGNIGVQLAYNSSVRQQMEDSGKQEILKDKIKLPGLPKLQSQVAIPLLAKDKLIGVLAVESELTNVFDERDELIITIIANQAASAIENARLYELEKLRISQLHAVNEDLRKLNESLEEKVEERTLEVLKQKEIVEEKNRQVLASITYAKRIQNTILPSVQYLNENMPEHMIFYRPKDIVSGDFYWVNKKDDKLFVGAIDCTGHGVPGALVSIVAHSNLQRAIHIFKLRTPAELLDLLNEAVKNSFHKQGEEELRDGMDIALFSLDREKRMLEFSGANNSLYIINSARKTWPENSIQFGDEMPGVEIKGDKQPIGYFATNKKFTQHSIVLETGDVLYVFSDGYEDQFGGPRNKKFMSKRLKELLISVHQLPMEKQKKLIEQSLQYWKGDNEQTDDILIIGVKI